MSDLKELIGLLDKLAEKVNPEDLKEGRLKELADKLDDLSGQLEKIEPKDGMVELPKELWVEYLQTLKEFVEEVEKKKEG